MLLFRLMGLFALIPATILLAVSFFVLFAIRRLEAAGLKAFGYVIAALLWAGALMVFSLGIYTVSTGRHPMMPCMMAAKTGMIMPGKDCQMTQHYHQQAAMKDKLPAVPPAKTDKYP